MKSRDCQECEQLKRSIAFLVIIISLLVIIISVY
jgi:membrane protein CcdC involved in cytochrome C biogenesis